MTKPFQQWTVLRHGKVSQIDEGILTVVGEIHMPTATRRCKWLHPRALEQDPRQVLRDLAGTLT
jgi:hypothetical protein